MGNILSPHSVSSGGDQDAATGWISAHLFHRGSHDELITSALAPVIEELTCSGTLAKFFFLRYWEGGPHLRVRLLPTGAEHAHQMRSALLARGTHYLTSHPSPPLPATYTAEAYRVMAQRMALVERRTDHDPQLHPDDAIEFIPYRPEYTAYGRRPTLTAVETHFTESSTIALNLITAGTPPAQRHAAALAMLMLTLAVCEPDLARITSRLRDMPPGRTPQLTAADPASRALADSYRQTRQGLHHQARDLWARAHDPHQTPLSGSLAGWLHSIRTLHAQLTTAHAQGQFAPTDSLSPLTRLTRAVGPQLPALTQVLLRCSHLLCNRLGIHTTAEAHLVSLVTRTLTDLDQETRPMTTTAPSSTLTAADTSWYSTHIYYYEPDKDALILNAIRPLLRQLRPVVERAYLVRHWRQGPHLRVHIRTDPHTWTTTVQPQLEQTIGTYLQTHPSTASLDEHTELPTHRLLAEREQEHGPLTPWYPDNSIQYQPYDPRLHVLGDQQVTDLLADYLTAATEPLFEMLDYLRSGADTKELLSLGLMLATSHTLAPPLHRSFMSYRSHAEAFMAGSTDPEATRAAFGDYYRTHREALTDRVQTVVATLEDRHDGPPVPFVRDWAALLTTYADQAMPLIEAELVYHKTPAPPPTNRPRRGYLHMLFSNRAYRERVLDTPHFRRYRLGINWTYLQLNRLGVTPYQRMRTCYIVASAVEDVYDVSVDDMVNEFAQQHANQPTT